MAFSGDSEIDDILTPIGGSPDGSLLGQLLESDSPVDLFHYGHEEDDLFKSKQTKSKQFKSAYPKQRKPTKNLKQKPKPAKKDEEEDLTKDDIKRIYSELQAISDKLRKENSILHEREAKLRDRERMVSISQESLQTITDHQIKLNMATIEEKLKKELGQMELSLRERTKESKRLKENFETIKQANDVLKKEVEQLKTQNSKLTKSNTSLQARLNNYQRKTEYEQRVKEADLMKLQTEADQGIKESKNSTRESDDRQTKIAKSSKATLQSYSGVLSTLLDWVSESHLRQSLKEVSTKSGESNVIPTFIADKVFRILPSLVDILRENASNIRCCLPCLQFIYWSLLHIDNLQSQQNVSMSTTTRRLGEEIYFPKTSKVSEIDRILGTASLEDKQKDHGLFLHSSNSHVRFLSALIIIRTLSQADVIAQAFDVIKTELKSDQTKELFLYYQATNVITSFVKPTNKNFISVAIDVMLQMSGESPSQQGFLESCSNEAWFRAAALVVRTPFPDTKIQEKLSILLQKLSKIKCNKRFFEIYTIVAVIQEMLVSGGNENAFLSLNLKSILFNLNANTQPKS